MSKSKTTGRMPRGTSPVKPTASGKPPAAALRAAAAPRGKLLTPRAHAAIRAKRGVK